MDIDSKLVKEILIWCRDNLTLSTNVNISKISFPGYSQEQVNYHLVQLVEAGYIDCFQYTPNDYRYLAVTKLSWEGHEYLNLLLSNTLGKQLLEFCDKMGIKPFPLILEFLSKIAPPLLLLLGKG